MSEHTPGVAIIVAVARNGVIGRKNTLPFRLPSDLKRFKALTLGHTLIMGRHTFASIGKPLPGRTTIVVTRSMAAFPDGVLTANSLTEALGRAGRPVFLAGGAGIYAEGLAFADTLYITRVDAEPAGDTFFKEVPQDQFALVERQPFGDERDDHPLFFETWVRVAV